MRNLAGRNIPKEVNDEYIATELRLCDIDKLQWDCGNSEVRTNFAGRLADFRFTRAWTYWMVDGPVPLDLARRIYAHPVGKTDIRVAGHCGCVAPEDPWITWRDPATGKKYAKLQDLADILKFKDKYPDMYTKFVDDYVFDNDPASKGAVGTVDSYHIDTELGLYVFVQFLKGVL